MGPQPLPMALVVANGGPGWGVLTTTGTTGDAPLPTCLARIVQEKNQVLVDALPYLDKEYDQPAMRDLVDGCGLVRARARARAGVL